MKQHAQLKTCLLALACGWTLTAHAIMIDFESASGYSTTGGTTGSYTAYTAGNLGGQGGTTKWSGPTNNTSSNYTDLAHVVTDPANASNQVLQTQVMPGGNTMGVTLFRYYPSTGAGGDLVNAFNASSSILNYSFQVRLDTAAATTAAMRYYFGSGMGSGLQLLQLELVANGVANNNSLFKYSDGTNTNLASAITTTVGSWLNVSGQINYATNTYTLFLNGTQQLGSNSQTDLGFYYKAPATSFADGVTGTSIGTKDAVFGFRDLNPNVSTSLDNLSLSVVPEPQTWAMIACGLLLLVGRVVRTGRMAKLD